MPDNNLLIPAARAQLWDEATNFVSRAWYRWFYNVYIALEAGRRHGSFYSDATFTPALINTPYEVTFAGVYPNSAYGVSIGTPASRIGVDNTAVYNVQFIAQATEYAAGNKSIYFWPRINGVDVSDRTIKATLSKGVGGVTAIGGGFMLSLSASDFIELVYAVDNVNIKLTPTAAAGAIPASPSVALTVTSNIGA